jgi:hypothetical protein
MPRDGLLTLASVAIDGSKFKAVNNRDKNFTRAKMERRMAQIEESVARYLEQLDTDDEFGFCGLPDWNIEGLFAFQDIAWIP